MPVDGEQTRRPEHRGQVVPTARPSTHGSAGTNRARAPSEVPGRPQPTDETGPSTTSANKARTRARESPRRAGDGRGGDVRSPPIGLGEQTDRGAADIDSDVPSAQPFTPVRAMPCTKTRWARRNTTIVGKLAISAPAITTFWYCTLVL